MSRRLLARCRQNKPALAKQAGISMAFLLFAIIIMSLLAAGLMRLNSQSTTANTQQVISTRAFEDRLDTIENVRQAMALFPVSGVGACANQIYNFSTTNGLSGCTATTSCTNTTINGVNYYQVNSVGQCNAGQPLQATRTIQVRLKDIRP